MLYNINAVFAAFDIPNIGVRPLGMGNAFTAVADDGNALYYNPAGLGQVKGTEFIGSYYRPFGLTVLQSSIVSLVHSAPFGTIGGGFYSFGRSGYYKEETFSVAYGKRVNDKLAAGASLQYYTIKILPLYGSDWNLGIDAGVLWSGFRKVRLGLYLHNINLPQVALEQERLPFVGRLGMAWYPAPGILLAMDACRDWRYPVQLNVGQEITFFRHLLLRTGVQTNPARFSVGAGIKAGFITADYVYCSHPVLGSSHQVGVRLVNKNMRKR